MKKPILQEFVVGKAKPFNFNLPEELRFYVDSICLRKFDNVAQYLLELIAKDKLEFGYTVGPAPIDEVYNVDPVLARYLTVNIIYHMMNNGAVRDHHVDIGGGAYKSFLTKIRQDLSEMTSRVKDKSLVLMCHNSMAPLVRHYIDVPFTLLTFDADIMKYHIVGELGSPFVYAIKKGEGVPKDEHGVYFFDDILLKNESFMLERAKMEAAAKNGAKEKERRSRILEQRMNDGTKVFLIQKETPSHISTTTLNDNGTASVHTPMVWSTVSQEPDLLSAQKELKKLRGEVPKIIEEIVHEN